MSSTVRDAPSVPEEQPLRPVQRSAAYAVARDDAGRVLLVRGSDRSDFRGRWFLPGGGLQHGEMPSDAVRRELAEETGLQVPTSALTVRDAVADTHDLPYRGVQLHTLRLIYDVTVTDPDAIRAEPDGTTDLAAWHTPEGAAGLPLMPDTAGQLGLPVPEVVATEPLRPQPLLDPPTPSDPVDGEVPYKFQRPAAYAVLIDGDPSGPDGRILLTRLSGGDLWTLPGGGIDHGEQPLEALAREVYEEAGLPYTAGPLLDIGSRHFTGRAPSGRLEDFHGIRLVYGGAVPNQPEPRTTEIGGSSDAAAWFTVGELDRIHVATSVWQGIRALRR